MTITLDCTHALKQQSKVTLEGSYIKTKKEMLLRVEMYYIHLRSKILIVLNLTFTLISNICCIFFNNTWAVAVLVDQNIVRLYKIACNALVAIIWPNYINIIE